MNSTLTRALCSLMVCLAFGLPRCYAQAGGPPGDVSPGRVFLQPGAGPADEGIGYAIGSPFGPWVGLDARIGDGIGWEGGYYGATAFIPRHFDPGISMMYSLINLSVTGDKSFGNYDGRGVLNVGGGYRYRNPYLNRIFGFAGFFDLDDGHNDTYKRVGVSVESLGKYLDFRANTYLVIGDDSNRVAETYVGDPFFLQNFLMLNRRTVTENAYGGADAEIGGLLPYVGRYGLSGYIGAYWLRHDDEGDEIGGKVRFEAQINEDFTVGVQHSHDDLFGSNTYASLSFTLPDGKPSRWFRPRPVKERMAMPVVREQRVAVHNKVNFSIDPLINPADNQPFLFAHIDPNRTTAGNGTIENPFNSTTNFANSAAYDVIYVRPGNANNLNTGIPLFNNQRLLSTSVTHSITSLQGTFTIPGFTGGANPVLSNPNLIGLPVIGLAANNEVSGFDIDGSNGVNPIIDGIRTPNAGINGGFNINRNTFTNTRDAVAIAVNTTATGIFSNNVLTGTGNTFPNGSDRGFAVTSKNAGTVLTLTVDNNTADGYRGFNEDVNQSGFLEGTEDTVSLIAPGILGGNGNGVLDTGTAFEVTALAGSTINSTITNNIEGVNNGSGTGLALNASGGTLNTTLTNNAFLNNVANNSGVKVTANGGVNNLTANNNNVSNNVGPVTLGEPTGNGFSIITRNAGVITANFSNNLVANNGNAAFFIDANTGTVNLPIFQDNDLSRDTAGRDGVFISAVNANINLGFDGVNVTPWVRNIIEAEATDANRRFGIGGTINGGTLNAYIGDGTLANSNLLARNGAAGIGFNLLGTAVADVRIRTNTIINSVIGAPVTAGFAGDGIRFIMTDDAQLAATSTIDDNTITGNAGTGFSVLAQLASIVPAGFSVRNNTISNNTGNGVDFTRVGTARIGQFGNVLITDNIITNNAIGVSLSAAGIDAYDQYTVARNLIQLNNSDGVRTSTIIDGDLRVDLTDNAIIQNVGNGVQATETSVAPPNTRNLEGVWTGNTIAGNTLNGILLNGSFGTDGTFLQIGNFAAPGFGSNTISANQLSGIRIDANGRANIWNNTISGNGTVGAVGSAAALATAGIDVNTLSFFGNELNIDTNNITANRGDGVELTANSTGTGGTRGTLDVTLNNNQITLNGNRGIDSLTGQNARTRLEATNNNISGNTFEGFYVVNTSAGNQSQTNASNAAMATTAVLINSPETQLYIEGNTINGNGFGNVPLGGAAFGGGGLAIRVGTSDNGDNSFASASNSGVIAYVNNNQMRANFGSDAFFQSFVSATPPGGSTDPLARLDLVFTNNTLDILDATNAGAAYSDSSQTKSPLGFVSNTRSRNAQRLLANSDTPDEGGVLSQNGQITTFTNPNNFASTIGGLSTANNAYTGVLLTFTSGLLNGQNSTNTAYTGATQTFTGFNPAFGAGAAVGDTFHLSANMAGIGASTFRVFNGVVGPSAVGNNTVLNLAGSSLFNDDVTNGAGAAGELDFDWGNLPAPIVAPFPPFFPFLP